MTQLGLGTGSTPETLTELMKRAGKYIRMEEVFAVKKQDEQGRERLVYYRVMQPAETRYRRIEKVCLSLVFAAQKLRNYLLAHPVQLVTKSDPIKYMLTQPALSRRTVRWLLKLSECRSYLHSTERDQRASDGKSTSGKPGAGQRGSVKRPAR